MKDVLKRLQRLEAFYRVRQGGLTVFRLDNGSLFHTREDPLTYVQKCSIDRSRRTLSWNANRCRRDL